jgi:predicted enzyme related to lactoylglutathione lyase
VTSDAELRVGWIMFDCIDQVRVSSFWQSLLELEDRRAIGPFVFLGQPHGVGLGFQQVESPTSGKNRVHIDLQTADIGRAAERVIALRGSVVSGYEAGGFLVLSDPEGNEFCILPSDGAHLDEAGVAHYQNAVQPAAARLHHLGDQP